MKGNTNNSKYRKFALTISPYTNKNSCSNLRSLWVTIKID